MLIAAIYVAFGIFLCAFCNAVLREKAGIWEWAVYALIWPLFIVAAIGHTTGAKIRKRMKK